MSKTFKIVVMASVIVMALAISGSMIYYFAFFKPRNDEAKWQAQLADEQEEWKAKLEWEKEKKAKEEQEAFLESLKETKEKQQEELQELNRQQALADCLDNAFERYLEQWDEECKELGRGPDCRLPIATADRMEEFHQRSRDECFKLYGD